MEGERGLSQGPSVFWGQEGGERDVTHTEDRGGDHRGRDGSGATRSQGTPAATRGWTMQRNRCFSRASGGTLRLGPGETDFGLLVSRAVREDTCVVLSHLVYDNLLQ